MAIETDNRGGGEREAAGYFYELPKEIITDILARTSPRDACRLCCASSFLCAAAESDGVWECFLPPDYPSIVSPHSRPYGSKKDLFISLCDTPLLIDQDRMSFSLEKEGGKKCCMIRPNGLAIVWGDNDNYWEGVEGMAKLIQVCWFEIRGQIDIQMLSPSTLYTVNLVFRASQEGTFGFEGQRVDASVGLAGGETTTRSVYLDSETEMGHGPHQIVPLQEGDNVQNHPREREDGLLETELGVFFFDGRQNGELEIRVLGVDGVNWKGGLMVQGIEIRPIQG